MELDGLFLDMYGTLTTGDRAAVEGVCAALVRDLDLPLPAAEFAVLWGNRFFALLDTLTPERFLTLYEAERESLISTLADFGRQADPDPYIAQLAGYWRDPPLQPETRRFLAEFPRPICIVSNADRVDLELALARHDIRVDRVVTSDDVRSYKPDRRIFDEALGLTGWRRDRVLHVGDSLHSDVLGAARAGLRSAWVNRAHRIHDIGTHPPDYELPDLDALTHLVRNSHGTPQ